jgi:hypothetical protein
MVADLLGGLDKSTQWAVEAGWPMLGLVLIVLMFRRTVSFPSLRTVPWGPCVVSILGLCAVHWFGHDLGLVTSDEVAGLIPEGWGLAQYLRGDSGFPSRFYRLFAWVLLPWKGLAAIHVLCLVAASIAAVLLASAAHRVAGMWGACGTWLVVFHVPWLEYTWEARAYAMFLMFCSWAVWNAVRDVDAEGPPPLGGVLVAVSFAAMDNPACMLLLVSAGLASLRRYGLSSIPKMIWGGTLLLGLACLPVVLNALTAHQKLGHTSKSVAFVALGLVLVATIPGVFVRGRRGWLAESGMNSALILCGAMLFGWVPTAGRVVLFVLPWCLVGGLACVPLHKPWARATLVVLLLLGLNWERNGGGHEVQSRTKWIEDARVVHEQLQSADLDEVRFEPRYTRIVFLSAVANLRFIQHRNFVRDVPEIPAQYRSEERVECAPGEVGIQWSKPKMVCECPKIAGMGSWQAYRCPEAPKLDPGAGLGPVEPVGVQ